MSSEKCIGLHRRFSKEEDHTHGYIIDLNGRYMLGRVKFIIKSIDPDKPGDLQDFINGRFDIKFTEEIVDIEEAKKYVFKDDFNNLYIKNHTVYMKREVDMNYILGGIICNVNREENSFWIYNKYWKNELPEQIVMPKNIDQFKKTRLYEKILMKCSLVLYNRRGIYTVVESSKKWKINDEQEEKIKIIK